MIFANSLKIKVCGMKYYHNIRQLLIHKPDFIGFIFYKFSKRFLDDVKIFDFIKQINSYKVGVFVDEDDKIIIDLYERLHLDFVQLHGSESPSFCRKLKDKNINIIKSFLIDDNFDFSDTHLYENIADYLLFDTKGIGYGGTGKKFNWSKLDQYDGKTSFFLSGGIDLNDCIGIKNIKNPKLMGVDINSRFEILPALKDIDKIQRFIKSVR